MFLSAIVINYLSRLGNQRLIDMNAILRRPVLVRYSETTLETVIVDTPALRATSLIEIEIIWRAKIGKRKMLTLTYKYSNQIIFVKKQLVIGQIDLNSRTVTESWPG